MTTTTLKLMRKSESNAIGDVIFFHGLGGNGRATWETSNSVSKSEKEQGFVSYFPSDLSDEFLNLNIWVIDYSTQVTEWFEGTLFDDFERHCYGLLEYLLANEIGSRPLVFICHSLGGIVVKEILRNSYSPKVNRRSQLFYNTRAVSFIATPHKGADLADILTKINTILPFIRTSDRINVLKQDNIYLEKLSAWFREQIDPEEIETMAFYEQKKTFKILVVPHYSANPDVSFCRPVGIKSNHLDISKPIKKSDYVYALTKSLIRHHLIECNIDIRGHRTANNIPLQTVVIGVVQKNDKILMVKRRNSVENLTWQFVGARLRVGQESEEECIVREVYEETNIHVKSIAKLGETIDSSSSFRRIYFHLSYLKGQPLNNDQKENVAVEWVEKNQIRTFVTSPISKLVEDKLEL